MLIVSDGNLEAANKAAEDITVKGQRSVALKADVTNEEEVLEIVAAAINDFDRINILVNESGIVRDAMLHQMTDEQWDAVVHRNIQLHPRVSQ